MKRPSIKPKSIAVSIAAAALLALALAAPAAALAAPVNSLDTTHQFDVVPAGGYGRYEVALSNSGDAAVNALVNVTFTVPAGMKIAKAGADPAAGQTAPAWTCTIAPDAQSTLCQGPKPPGQRPGPGQGACPTDPDGCPIAIAVKADAGILPGTILTPTVQACGGGAAACANDSEPTEIGPAAVFALTGFDGEALQQNGDPATQAGSHPHLASTTFTFTSVLDSDGRRWATQDLKDAAVKLPPGFLGDPQATATCTEVQLTLANTCPPESQVGRVSLLADGPKAIPGKDPQFGSSYSVYSLSPPQGTPAVFGFNIEGVSLHVFASLRTGADYGVTVTSKNAAETGAFAFEGVKFTFWGVPADSSHDAERRCVNGALGCASADAADPKPFLSLPTSCTGPVQTDLDITGWLGGSANSSFLSHDNFDTPTGNDGCPAVPFAPTIQARPTTNAGDAPSGLDVDLTVPQSEDPNGDATAHLKDTTVTLPEGLVINPSGANGLGGCSAAQFGYTSTDPDGTVHTTPDPASCPDAARVATVEVDSPLLDHPLQGSAYIANPFENPFNSLLALYITIDDPQTGIVAKLAGKVTPDPNTGQLTATFEDNPQLPFEHFKLHFKGGSHGTLRTPATCGTHTTQATLNPWSSTGGALAVDKADPWTIDANCSNSASEQPHAPGFDAGTVSPLANNYSPVVVNLSRPDGSQQFKTVTLKAPPGLSGKLAGIPACSEAQIAAAQARSNPGDGAAEQSNPSCPAASKVGSVDVAAGAGPAPFWAHGNAYMAPPYKGAPLSFVILTPAVAGPFDLGVVVVRTALNVDPTTAQITAVSDEIPAILDGIPLDVTQAKIHLDRDQFTRTGTSCDPSSFDGALVSTLDQSASLSERFQLGECSSLAFKPQFKLALRGGKTRNGHPAFTTTIDYPTGAYANLAKAQIILPKQMQLDQSHIQAPCTRPQFAANQCPDASVIGAATASSPLLDQPLTGPVYLRTGNNPLPDVVLALHGPPSQPIEIDQVGKVDTVHARLRTTFDTVPDAPLSSAVVSLLGGGKGLLVNNSSLCAQKDIATLSLEGHNGKAADSNPVVKVAGCPKPHKKHKHHKKHQRRPVA